MAGIYIHIPFCKQACNYCNFHFATSLHKKQAVVNAIIKEIALARKENFISDRAIKTVYFGGGTPSLLSVNEVTTILQEIRNDFLIDENAEITLEANPDDITQDILMAWQDAGINRLSIGIQSFFEEDLQWMHRTHNALQARESLTLATKYFHNITIDLIYGVPGMSNEKWKQNVDAALQSGVPHLSCYALTVEPRTPLHKLIRQKQKSHTDDAMQSAQFMLLMEWLQEAGYEHYEISNFAKPGYQSVHNRSYWTGEEYLGLGPSAHSYNGIIRRWNIANNQKYRDAIEKDIIPYEQEVLTDVQKTNEYIMLALRTMQGIQFSRVSSNVTDSLVLRAQEYIDKGLLIKTPGALQLTNEGKLYADGIAADLFL